MLQSPTLTSVTKSPDTVQTAVVVELKLTASAEVAGALGVTGPLQRRVLRLGKGDSLRALDDVKVRLDRWSKIVVGIADLPRGHVAYADGKRCTVTLSPETLQTVGVLPPRNSTRRPELAVAVRVTGLLESGVSPGGVKEIVCAPFVTLKLFVTVGAAL